MNILEVNIPDAYHARKSWTGLSMIKKFQLLLRREFVIKSQTANALEGRFANLVCETSAKQCGASTPQLGMTAFHGTPPKQTIEQAALP